MKANIVDIKRFAVHDGDGIRTTVFFKGCSLRCAWCHNPETESAQKQIAFYRHKCIGCGACQVVCSLHTLREGRHIFDRKNCSFCGKCVEVCLNNALEIFGKIVDTRRIIEEMLKDNAFYAASGGGVTLSGGECLLQADACAEILKELRARGVHTAVDTCGNVPKEAFDKTMPYTNMYLYDVKGIDEKTHIRCTGQSNRLILENLRYIDGCGCKTEIRIPYVPDYNADEREKILCFLEKLQNVTKIRVLPYHDYAASRYDALGMKNTLPPRLPSREEVDTFQAQADELLRKKCDKIVFSLSFL